ncbi:MAG: hypothetical protein KGI68_09450 [Alphaproteobacteria bacterium]|nr:hypothetical protein [Alphaproteobacteria bacterium]MDE1986032.1 hypothetical protein [Alphaproteobacteria bacterium]MDE2164045.1 hypothetical protein [Alphaproteobacteria bacterium]MDE2266747.1 hypothetical protein [Alphaproteobacteria bacterium]MDE2499635.1 hypothetical protein [Alphaproteobacteria bacterium]
MMRGFDLKNVLAGGAFALLLILGQATAGMDWKPQTAHDRTLVAQIHQVLSA